MREVCWGELRSLSAAPPRSPSRLLYSDHAADRRLHSFPTRRSSDLPTFGRPTMAANPARWPMARVRACTRASAADRKSTRLNSSHSSISYAVFCLKKKIHVQRLLIDGERAVGENLEHDLLRHRVRRS